MLQQALPALREFVRTNPGGPVVYGGSTALNLLAEDLRGTVPASISNSLVWFVLPLAGRRRLDAAAFLREAGKAEAAALMEQQAKLVGQAQGLATAQRWTAVADVVERLASLEERLASCL
jgi:hypothetical protein